MLSSSQRTFWRNPKPGILACFLIASFLVNISLIQDANNTWKRRGALMPAPESHSFIGPDYPSVLPVERHRARITVEESVHFTVANPEAGSEYLWTAPYGDNHMRLGLEMRAFSVVMFHQLHCLRLAREALMTGWDKMQPRARKHIHHCFNCIRQLTLCDSDLTLEPGDFTQRNFTVERFGATHTCVDWQPIYDLVNDGWFKWEDYRISHGVPLHEELRAAT